MKKIIALALVMLFAQGAVMAQKAKSVKEDKVPERYVKDFHNKEKGSVNVAWYQVDSLIFDAVLNTDMSGKKTYRFSPKGTEIRYEVESKYWPHAIQDTVKNMFPHHSIRQVDVLNIKNKTTYQVRIAQMKGFLFFGRKEKDVKLLNFQTDGKFIDAIDVR